jgi:hypothetical protein
LKFHAPALAAEPSRGDLRRGARKRRTLKNSGLRPAAEKISQAGAAAGRTLSAHFVFRRGFITEFLS